MPSSVVCSVDFLDGGHHSNECMNDSVGGPERWRVIAVACGGRHTMALALPDNGEVNNREVSGRRLTSDSGGIADLEEEQEDEEYEHHGELQNGEYDDEDGEPGKEKYLLDLWGNKGSLCGDL